ncbi:MAG TPA: wax ester/triacylglycerol synthase family O-acyltransferase [Acidimicrobiia bacterium]|nr:wax ester/triacylglycerol synthase family O-acyltransferase [Acidimicrobiia bacterium]
MPEITRFAHHMSDEDALMWNIEKDPILRSTIIAVAMFDGVPDWNVLRRRMERTSRLIPRFRQRVLSPPLRMGPPRWTVEPTFDLDFHLRRTRLPGAGTERALLDALQPMATSSFDRARPLWEFTLIEGLEGPDGERAALAMKVHHSVTDGVGGMELLAHMVDLTRDAEEPSDEGVPAAPPPERLRALDLVRESAAHTRRRVFGVARRLPSSTLRAATTVVRDPLGRTTEVLRTARSIGRALAPATSPMSPVMCERGLGRRLDSFDVSLDDLRRAAKAAEGSLNDAFVAAVVGGLMNYHDRHGCAPAALRMTLPINLRHGAHEAGGNRFAPARFPVPLSIADPVERIHAIRGLVRGWRAEPALQMTSTLAGVLNRLPTTTTTALFGGMLKCCDFVTSNVPGAPVPVYAGGARVERLYAFGPPSGAAFNITLISHNETCCIGIVVDTTAVPDPDVLVDALRAGFDEVLALG